MKKLGPFGNGHSDYDEWLQDEDTYVLDDPDWCEPSGGAVELYEDDDGLGDDVPSFRHTPYCPMDTLDALELCGRLLDDLAHGKPFSRAKEVMAAGQAVKCLEKYNYELQEWFFDAREAAAKREVNEIGTGDDSKDAAVDEGLGDHRDRESAA